MSLAPILACLAMLGGTEPPVGLRADLPSDARLFIPDGWHPRDGAVDLIFHLHGTPTISEPALVAAGWDAVLVSFNRKGLSAAYSGPFSDAALFPKLIDEALEAVNERRPGGPFRPGRVVISSFSAGFGGVRELLKQPEAFDRIDAVVLADSLYCGYAGDPAEKRVSPELMAGFRRFAREAADGRKAMLVTHSAQFPPGYGSTTETADDLLKALGIAAAPDSTNWGDGWRQTRQAAKGRFSLIGFAGEGPDDHMRHLRRIGELWKRLPDPFDAGR